MCFYSRLLILCITTMLFGIKAQAIDKFFMGLGDLPDGEFRSHAHSISADGSVVVGSSNSKNGPEAFRWTKANGLEGLGDLSGGKFGSEAFNVSADGSVVVGYATSTSGIEVFRWTKATGMNGLGVLVNPYYPPMISADGSVVVFTDIISESTIKAFRWTEADGLKELGDLFGGEFKTMVFDVSTDGSVVVGYSNSKNGPEAFRWTIANGIEGLGDLPDGEFHSVATSVSADGSVVVGSGSSKYGKQAFRWTKATGLEGLGDLPGGEYESRAYHVSADGSVVSGQSDAKSGSDAFRWTKTGKMLSLNLNSLNSIYHDVGLFASRISDDGNVILVNVLPKINSPVIWNNKNGVQVLKNILINKYAVDMNGWGLENASGISSDGIKIVGYGTNPDGKREAWIVSLRNEELRPTTPDVPPAPTGPKITY